MTDSLASIGFYTLSDARARSASASSPLQRCELVLTDACNFRCPYCRGLAPGLRGTLPRDEALATLDAWIAGGLRNVRLSGGEPTLYPWLYDLVRRCRDGGVERIALSTNGSAPLAVYERMIAAGVNDLSVSLDAGCCALGDTMTGGVCGSWERTTETIRALASLTYVTAGLVFTEQNADAALDTVLCADALGVADIRVIPSAQYARAVPRLLDVPGDVLARHPILRWRIERARRGLSVRGLTPYDCGRCRLVLDDMAVVRGLHFPCIIYLREQGQPIGRVGPHMRAERAAWSAEHDSYADPICRANCLDVCIAYNNVAGGIA